MEKKQLHIRASARTQAQIKALKVRWGETITGVIATCVDRVYQSECPDGQEGGHAMVRELTQAEIEAFSGMSSVDVAIQSSDGKWYYGDSNPTATDPSGYTEAGFVCDEDGYYIAVAH
jgi:hypothetical protein